MSRSSEGTPDGGDPPSALETPLAAWREYILSKVLRWGSFLLVLPWALGTWAALDGEIHLLALISTGGYLFLLAIALLPRLSFAARASGLLFLCWGIGLAVIFLVGPLGAGTLWLASVPVLATFLFGTKGAVWGLVGVGATLLALSGFAASETGLGPPEGVPPDVRYDLAAWLANLGSVMGLGALLSLPFAVLLHRTERALIRERSARAELEEEAHRREALEARLRQRDRLEALGTFAGGIAHDFNNLLVPILGEAEEIQGRAQEGSPEAERAKGIIVSATRARELVRNILSFSRMQADDLGNGAPSPGSDGRTKPSLVLTEVIEQLRLRITDEIDVILEDRSNDLAVEASALQLHQILMNLATNAAMAMAEHGGELRVELEPEPGSLRIRVSDTGHGMEAETVARVFDPFFTTRPIGQGTGLGLSTVHGIVGRLGGRIEIDSAPDRGTQVEVLLPAATGDAAGAAPSPATAPSRTSGRAAGTLLVVDDDPAVRATTERALRRLGYRPIMTSSGREALERLDASAREGAPIPLVLTDRSMPEMDGIELAERIRRSHPDTAVVLVTGNVDGPGVDSAHPGSDEGLFAAVLAKPYRLEELRAVVEGAARSAPANPAGPPPDERS